MILTWGLFIKTRQIFLSELQSFGFKFEHKLLGTGFQPLVILFSFLSEQIFPGQLGWNSDSVCIKN